jgi:hypothetical protein
MYVREEERREGGRGGVYYSSYLGDGDSRLLDDVSRMEIRWRGYFEYFSIGKKVYRYKAKARKTDNKDEPPGKGEG